MESLPTNENKKPVPQSTIDARRRASSKWAKEHKDKMAEYSRNFYFKKIESDPDFRKKLSERVLRNKAIRENKEGIQNKKGRGRPRLHPDVVKPNVSISI